MASRHHVPPLRHAVASRCYVASSRHVLTSRRRVTLLRRDITSRRCVALARHVITSRRRVALLRHAVASRCCVTLSRRVVTSRRLDIALLGDRNESEPAIIKQFASKEAGTETELTKWQLCWE